MGDPTRHAVFRHLAEAGEAVTVAELTEAFGLNHNAIRQHLAKLVAADLVTETRAQPTGPGRPRLLYAVRPDADGRWGVISPYERLALLLTDLVRTGDTPVVVGRRAGRRMGRGGRIPAVPGLVDQLARLGFEPTARPADDDRVDVTLHACPFTAAVLHDADVICELHLGLAQGLAESVGGVTVEDLEVNDPRQARCRLRCRPTPSD